MVLKKFQMNTTFVIGLNKKINTKISLQKYLYKIKKNVFLGEQK